MRKQFFSVITVVLSLLTSSVFANVTTLNIKDPSIIKQLYMPQGNVAMGNPKGAVTLVEFFGYDCHYCRDFYPELQTIIAAHPNLRVVYKEYLVFGKLSQWPAYAAIAAAKQNKYAQMHDAMMTATKPLNLDEIMTIAKQQNLNMDQFKKDIHDPIVQSYVKQNVRLETQLGLEGIPQIVVAPTGILLDPNKYTQYLVSDVDTKSVNEAIKKAQNEVR